MLILSAGALARTWVVDLERCGDFRTIEEAFIAVSDGDTIWIRPGVYQMADHVYTYADAVTIEGADRDTTIIDGAAGPRLPFRLFLNNTVRNLTFLDFHTDGGPISIGGTDEDGGQFLIENVTIANSLPNDGSTDAISGMYLTGNVDVTLRNVSISGYDIGVVPYVWTRSLVIENSIVEGRTGGVYTGLTSSGFCGDSLSFDHSFFVGGDYGIGLTSHDDYACDHPTVSITNNVFAGADDGPFLAMEGLTGFADNNLVLGPEVEIEPYDLTITNTIFVDSGVVAWTDDDDYTNDDLHLVAGSAAVDAAVDWVTPSATDAEGRPRPLDGDGDGIAAYDIGPYEYDPADPGVYDDGIEPVDTGDCIDTADPGDSDSAIDTDTDTGHSDTAAQDTGDQDSAAPVDTGATQAKPCGCQTRDGLPTAWAGALLASAAVRRRRR